MSRHNQDDDLAYGDGYNSSPGYGNEGTERGIVGDAYRKLRSRYQQSTYGQQLSGQGGQQNYGQPQQQNLGTTGPSPPYGQYNQPSWAGSSSQQQKPDLVSKIFSGLTGAVQSIGTDVAGLLGTQYQPQQQTQYGRPSTSTQGSTTNRFDGFVSEKSGNDVKWYVDGCSYMWAVSKALEGAKDSIWILDWWLSPELYLRRPPAQNEGWRLDRTLLRAAQRGVKVNIIVYKEVTQALTLSSSHTKHALEALHPNIAVFRHPDHLPDAHTAESSLLSSLQGLRLDAAGASKLGSDALKAIYGFSDDQVLFWAHHEKLLIIDSNFLFMGGLDLCFGRWDLNQHPISDAHPEDLNEILFPGQDFNNGRIMDFNDVAQPFQNKLDRTKSSRMGWSDISISLKGPCVNDLCLHFINRWNFVFDEKYNTGDPRYYRLTSSGRPASNHQQQVPLARPQQSNLSPQAGYAGSRPQFPPPPGSQAPENQPWQSTSRPHTPQQANQQYEQGPPNPSQSPYPYARPTVSSSTSEYSQYYPPPPPGPPPVPSPQQQRYDTPQVPVPQTYQPYRPPEQSYQHSESVSELPVRSYGTQPSYTGPYSNTPAIGLSRDVGEQDYYEGDESSERGLGTRFNQYRHDGRQFGSELSSIGNMISGKVQHHLQNVQGTYLGGHDQYGRPLAQPYPAMSCQVVRSCTKWSNGTPTEHSIQDAYIHTIQSANHFIYIENQFFITATGDQQHPVKNQIGKALLDRILRAALGGEKFKVIVLIPSVPGFAGDLRDDSSLGTRAIMEYQYDSINRGGHSIMEGIAKAGFNPMDYIRFFNLRNYDRINAGKSMTQIEQNAGVSYNDARKQHDDFVGAGFGGQGEGTGITSANQGSKFQQYQKAAQKNSGNGRWDSVSECYMLNGADIRNVPWDGTGDCSEIDAFVSEELYIHSKVLIADDRTVICGSANLNDRSMLGSHDSEIALVISDSTPVHSYMAGQPWLASRFATSLRRQLFRKHLGLLPPQDPTRPDANFDLVGVPNVYDWGSPEDNIVSDPLSDTFQAFWNTRARTNTEMYRKVFHAVPDDQVTTWNEYKEFYEYYFHKADGEAQGKDRAKQPARYEWGHVVSEDFPGGVQEVKEFLSKIKGTLVEMPLCFLQGEDIAKQGLTLNPLTEEVYT